MAKLFMVSILLISGCSHSPNQKYRRPASELITTGESFSNSSYQLSPTSSSISQNGIQGIKLAFSPIKGSPYAHMADFEILENQCIESVWDEIPHRYTLPDFQVAKVTSKSLSYYRNRLVLLDSGGPHSILAAVDLVEKGFQPIFKIRSEKSFFSIQTIGVMKHVAERMALAKQKLGKDAPPVFILDTHRDDDFAVKGLPSVGDVRSEFGGRVVWITERGPGHSTLPPNYKARNSSKGSQFSPITHPIQKDIFHDFLREVKKNNFHALEGYISAPDIKVMEHGVDPYFYGEGSVYRESPRPETTSVVPNRGLKWFEGCQDWSDY